MVAKYYLTSKLNLGVGGICLIKLVPRTAIQSLKKERKDNKEKEVKPEKSQMCF